MRRARFGRHASRQASKRHYQLAHRLAVAEGRDRFAGVFERIGRADPRGDLALRPPAKELLDMGGVRLGISCRKGAPEDTADITTLEEGEVEREPGDAGREADH